MCDYSLHAFPNRLAVDGEDLVVHRFGGASLGLASPADLQPIEPPRSQGKFRSWARIREWFRVQPLDERVPRLVPAVCVPPGTTLILRDIPFALQLELGVSDTEQVRFVEITAQVNTYRDAVRFSNCRQVLLQALREGQRATVVSTTPAEDAALELPAETAA